MSGAIRALTLMALLMAAAPTYGQQPQSDLAVIQMDQLFQRTIYGKAMQARDDQARADLLAENQRIEAALEAEERDLTARRATMPASEFRALADAFDAKVEDIRNSQTTKSRALVRQAEEDRQRFFDVAGPVLSDLMVALGATVLIDRANVIHATGTVDITDQAIARIDAVLGDGTALPPPSSPGQTAP
ncbi:OmpH family outer membrane protein [Gemmobacter denitrificans]|uniref:OmpH family outer membrane protein n=1 Tax=Gemmobacter denitrificans TaxID=3123040 RepID=A0ABU8BPM7_9RHOB